ncbi:MAG: tyrosine-type recombinase/integrase [Bdellovibrionota bacterium]|jgi:site-specific recombinase XerD|nr:tyrosine-type recombinase/integrase [Bdellovibrionota bacterium]
MGAPKKSNNIIDSRFNLHDEFFANYTSEHTRKNYKTDLIKFLEYLHDFAEGAPKDLCKVEREHVITYRNFLLETGGHDGRPSAPKTVARKLASLSSYFDYLVEKGEREFNPVQSVKRPRREVIKPTQALEKEQVRALFEILSQGDKESSSRFLHRALLVSFFMTGMRKAEVLSLRFKDYREINDLRVFEFVGKGGKVGQKVLHPLVIEALEEYLEWMKAQGREHASEDWLFQPTRNPSDPSNLNKPLNPRTINEIISKYGKKIGLNFSISPHSARATFIGELLEAGVDIYSVAREVNHSSVKTTQEYDKRRKKLSDSPISKLRY